MMWDFSMKCSELHISSPEVKHHLSRIICFIPHYFFVLRPWNGKWTFYNPFNVIKGSSIILVLPGIVQINLVTVTVDFDGLWAASLLKEVV
jgi:hypothetical protein